VVLARALCSSLCNGHDFPTYLPYLLAVAIVLMSLANFNRSGDFACMHVCMLSACSMLQRTTMLCLLRAYARPTSRAVSTGVSWCNPGRQQVCTAVPRAQRISRCWQQAPVRMNVPGDGTNQTADAPGCLYCGNKAQSLLVVVGVISMVFRQLQC
jgi:hypothetical protein